MATREVGHRCRDAVDGLYADAPKYRPVVRPSSADVPPNTSRPVAGVSPSSAAPAVT